MINSSLANAKIDTNLERRIRLSIVTETCLPDVNGVAYTVDHLLKGLLALPDYQIQLIALKPSTVSNNQTATYPISHPRLQDTRLTGIHLPFYPEVRIGLPHYFYLKRLWIKQRPDMVQIVTEGLLGWAALKAAQALNIPVISDFHTNFDQYTQHYKLGFIFKPINAYLRALHNQTLLTFVPTLELKNQLQQQGYRQLALLSRGIDTQRFNPQRRQAALREHWGVRPEQLVVILVTRLAAEKNLDLAFHAFREIQRQTPEARLVIVGDGPERQRLHSLYPDALFVGMQRGDALAEHYASGDLFLYPSLSETYGNVIVEAMASGLPVLCFNYAAGRQHIRTGNNGWTVPVGDTEAFIEASLHLAQQPALRQRLGEQAVVSVANLSWQAVVQQFDQSIQTLLSVLNASEEKTNPPELHQNFIRQSSPCS